MKGKFSDALKEYVKKISDEDLRFIHVRLTQRMGGDVAEVVELMQKNSEIDRWLAAASNANDFFDLIDQIDFQVQNEVKKRFITYEQKEKKESRNHSR